MLSHTTNIRIRYAETDQMKVVYYANYFIYFETGRTELLRSLGLPYSELEKQGYILPVIEAHAKYYRSASYDNSINIVTIMKDIPTVKIRLDYEVKDPIRNELIVEGYTLHSFVNSKTRRPTRAPEIFLKTIEKAFNDKR
jgi:acyl-CoA thioester hydrolase